MREDDLGEAARDAETIRVADEEMEAAEKADAAEKAQTLKDAEALLAGACADLPARSRNAVMRTAALVFADFDGWDSENDASTPLSAAQSVVFTLNSTLNAIAYDGTGPDDGFTPLAYAAAQHFTSMLHAKLREQA